MIVFRARATWAADEPLRRSGAGRGETGPGGRGVVGDRLTSGKLFIGAAQRWVFRQVSTGFQCDDRRRRAQARLPPAKRSRHADLLERAIPCSYEAQQSHIVIQKTSGFGP